MSDASLPSARFTRNHAILALACVPFVVGIAWANWHVNAVIAALQGRGSPLATTFLVSLLLL
jgi:hypothetical protein